MFARPLFGAGLTTLAATLAIAATPLQARNSAEQARPAAAQQVDAANWQRENTAKMDKFIADLMAKMTLEEKIGQMTLLTSDLDVTGPTLREGYRDDVRAGCRE